MNVFSAEDKHIPIARAGKAEYLSFFFFLGPTFVKISRELTMLRVAISPMPLEGAY